MARPIILGLACLVLAVALANAQFAGIGSLNRGAAYGEAGNVAQSVFGKQAAQGATQQAQTARAAQGQQAQAAAAASQQATAYGKNAYEQRIAQELTGVLNYCEGYVCTEWLDEYGSAYTNAGAKAYQDAVGYGSQSQRVDQASAADRAAYAAAQQNAVGEQVGQQSGAVRGEEGYGAGVAGVGSAWNGFGQGSLYAPNAISGSQAGQLGLNTNAAQYGSAYGNQAAAQKAGQAQSGYQNAREVAAAEAAAALANSQNAQQSSYNVEQLSRLKNYGRKCRRYQCYHKYWDGSVVSYGPNYYTSTGQAVTANQDQAAQQAAYADQDVAAKQAGYAAQEGAAQQYGAGAAGAGQQGFVSDGGFYF